MKQEDVQPQQEDVQHQDEPEMSAEVIDDEAALDHVNGSIAMRSNYAMVGAFTGAGAYMGCRV